MKIALLLSGQIRKFSDSFPAIKEYIINPLKCDLFVRVCKDENINELYDYVSEKDCKELEVAKDFFITPVGICPFFIDKNNRVQRYYQQLYGLYKVNEQRKRYEISNNFKYDCIIRCRVDLTPLELLNYNFNKFKSNTLYVPNNNGHGGINDQFAIGDSSVIDLYCYRLYVIQKMEYPNNNAEQQLEEIIKINNINIEKFPFKYKLSGVDVGIKLKKSQVYKEE